MDSIRLLPEFPHQIRKRIHRLFESLLGVLNLLLVQPGNPFNHRGAQVHPVRTQPVLVFRQAKVIGTHLRLPIAIRPSPIGRA